MTSLNSASRRYLALWLPLLPTDRLHRQRRRAGTPPHDQPLVVLAKVKSALRIAHADRRARELGLHPGLTLADARARVPAVETVDDDPIADQELLGDLAEWCDRYTPLVALDGVAGLMLDITGCAHLFGGEASMRADMMDRLARMGFAVVSAVAGTPAAARALAQYSPGGIVPPSGEAVFVRNLPLAALGLDEEAVLALRRAGLRTVADIADRPRAPLAARFGSELIDRLMGVLGLAESPISPRRPVPALIVERRFAEPIARADDIVGTLRMLADRLVPRLEARGEGGRSFEASFFRADGAVRRIAIETGQPLRNAVALVRLFAERIDALADPIDPGFGFDMIRLTVVTTQAKSIPQMELGKREHDAEEFSALLDRLSMRFGPEHVLRFVPHDSHLPERSARLVAAIHEQSHTTGRELGRLPPPLRGRVGEGGVFEAQSSRIYPPPCPSPGRGEGTIEARGSQRIESPPSFETSLWVIAGDVPQRPLCLFDPPEPIETIAEVPDEPPVRFRWRRVTHEIVRAEGPERIASEWWREDALTRDYFRVEDRAGHRFWLYREGLYGSEAENPRWFLHGLFA